MTAPQATCVYCNGPQHLAGAVCSLKPSNPAAKAREIAADYYLSPEIESRIAAALEAERKAGREDCGPTKKGRSGALPTSNVSNDIYDGLHNLCNERIQELTKQGDEARQAALEEAAEIVQKAAALLPEDLYRQKEAMEIIAQRIHNLQAEKWSADRIRRLGEK